MTDGLLVVTFPGRGPVAGLVVRRGRVERAAPAVRYALGWPGDRARTYFLGRGCGVRALPDSADPPGDGEHAG